MSLNATFSYARRALQRNDHTSSSSERRRLREQAIDSSTSLVCVSRFHEQPSDKREIWLYSSFQYTCTACRQKWSERMKTAEQLDKEKLEEERKAHEERVKEQEKIRQEEKAREDEAVRLFMQRANEVVKFPKAGTVYPHNRSYESLSSELRGQKRKPGIIGDNPREKKSRRIEAETRTNAPLPPEVISRALAEALHSTARCALDLIVPDWHPCKQYNPLSENPLNLARVVTYTRGIGGEVGSLSTGLGHGDGDHNFLHVKFANKTLLTLNKWYNNEVTRTLCLEGAQVFELTADGLPPNVTEESSLGNRRDTFPIRGKRSRGILPYDDEEPEADKKVMPSGSPSIFKLLRHIVLRSPLTLMGVDARSMIGFETQIDDDSLEALDIVIDLDRGSPIWLSWSQMPMLESVLLDLRIYSHDINTDRGCIGKGEIIRRAREMSRWLRLKLLVIAGLQSYSFDTSYDAYTTELIEEVDEINGEPNWIKVFSPALRPGGQLILVDRLMD
ncbi:hypothetical protein F4814DRAFT_451146 [Daldinia grandis]|nr:hypothetical protein F4814DRAFT_451146 [Daldinia grandis]